MFPPFLHYSPISPFTIHPISPFSTTTITTTGAPQPPLAFRYGNTTMNTIIYQIDMNIVIKKTIRQRKINEKQNRDNRDLLTMC